MQWGKRSEHQYKGGDGRWTIKLANLVSGMIFYGRICNIAPEYYYYYSYYYIVFLFRSLTDVFCHSAGFFQFIHLDFQLEGFSHLRHCVERCCIVTVPSNLWDMSYCH